MTSQPNPHDLLVLLAVARTGRYVSAATELGLNHTTVARRISALETAIGGRVIVRGAEGWEMTDLGRSALVAAESIEKAVGSLAVDRAGLRVLHGVVRMSATDGFSAYLAAPAVADVRRLHPGISVELVSVTRRAALHRSGLDLEVVVGKPRVHRAQAIALGEYELGLYVAASYAQEHGMPESVHDLVDHPLIYFIESQLHVDDLDLLSNALPASRSVSSTNVFVHVEATRAGAGVGLLPCFMADRHADLIRVMPEAVATRLTYWLVSRPETLRRPEVEAVVDALITQVRASQSLLLGSKSSVPPLATHLR